MNCSAWRHLVLWCSLLIATAGFCLDPGKPLSQYNHYAWRVTDGIRFTLFTSTSTSTGTRSSEPIRSPIILSTRADRDGSLWIGTGSDLEHWQDGRLTHYCVLIVLVLLRMLYVMRLRQHARRVKLQSETKAIERERIARDLHDTLLQGLQGLIYKMSAIAERLPESEASRGAMEQALDRAESMLVQGRDQLTGLRREPVAETSLPEALAGVAEDLELQTHGEFKLSVHGIARELNASVREEVYRIGAEALVNAFRYAAAPMIEVEILYDDAAVTLRVRDNGQGFDGQSLRQSSRPGRFGLLGLKERADRIGGELEIWSREGAGTEMSCRVDAEQAYRNAGPPGIKRWIRRFWSAGDEDD